LLGSSDDELVVVKGEKKNGNDLRKKKPVRTQRECKETNDARRGIPESTAMMDVASTPSRSPSQVSFEALPGCRR
jgi:hypothetical protein